MNREQIRDNVFKSLKQVAPEAEINELDPAKNIREALDIDSFDYLNFLIALNDKLGIDIPESDYDQLATLDDIVSYIDERME